jgi:TonB family protein
MKRVFVLVVVCAFASACAADTFAQARRVRRPDPPKDERAEKSETKDKANVEAKDEAQSGDDQPLTAKEVTKRAVIKSKPEPGYPRGARAYGVEGAVKLRIILGSDGRVRDEVEVIEGLPHGVTEEAIKVARRIAFEPARDKDGRPVSQYVTVIYHFHLY